MGHVPSAELSTIPLHADLQTSKGHVDRLVGVALTKWNFPSIECPQFQQFVNLRCDPHVLHWFNVQNAQSRSTLPTAPTPEYLYERHITAISNVIEQGVPREEFFPVPFVLFRHNTPGKVHPTSGGGQNAGHLLGIAGKLTMDDIVRNIDQFHAVGYLGCRGHNPTTNNLISLFLEKSFWNEAKSISIFQVGCKMYEHFSLVAGLKEPRWPTELKARALDTNLPLLRLIQKIYRDFGRPLEINGGKLSIEHSEERLELTTSSECLRTMCTALAATVKPEGFVTADGYCRFRLHTQGSGTTPAGAHHPTPFDPVIEYAKSKWSENNLLVSTVKAQQQAQQQQLQQAAAAAAPLVASQPIAPQARLKEKTHSRKSSSSSNAVPTPDESTCTEPHALDSFSAPPPPYEKSKATQFPTVRLPAGTAVTVLVPSTTIPTALTPLSALWSDDTLTLRTSHLNGAGSSNGQVILELCVPKGYPVPLLEPKSRAPIACAAGSPCLVILSAGTILWVPQPHKNPTATGGRKKAMTTASSGAKAAATTPLEPTIPSSDSSMSHNLRGPLLPFVV